MNMNKEISQKIGFLETLKQCPNVFFDYYTDGKDIVGEPMKKFKGDIIGFNVRMYSASQFLELVNYNHEYGKNTFIIDNISLVDGKYKVKFAIIEGFDNISIFEPSNYVDLNTMIINYSKLHHSRHFNYYLDIITKYVFGKIRQLGEFKKRISVDNFTNIINELKGIISQSLYLENYKFSSNHSDYCRVEKNVENLFVKDFYPSSIDPIYMHKISIREIETENLNLDHPSESNEISKIIWHNLKSYENLFVKDIIGFDDCYIIEVHYEDKIFEIKIENMNLSENQAEL